MMCKQEITKYALRGTYRAMAWDVETFRILQVILTKLA